MISVVEVGSRIVTEQIGDFSATPNCRALEMKEGDGRNYSEPSN